MSTAERRRRDFSTRAEAPRRQPPIGSRLHLQRCQQMVNAGLNNDRSRTSSTSNKPQSQLTRGATSVLTLSPTCADGGCFSTVSQHAEPALPVHGRQQPASSRLHACSGCKTAKTNGRIQLPPARPDIRSSFADRRIGHQVAVYSFLHGKVSSLSLDFLTLSYQRVVLI